jgi:hypothetical protein
LEELEENMEQNEKEQTGEKEEVKIDKLKNCYVIMKIFQFVGKTWTTSI